MSRSHKTAPTRIIAKRQMSAEYRECRIRELAPRDGDVHPLQKRHVERMLKDLPPNYRYGLRAVELRSRQGDIGVPFGLYLNDERKVWLYSLPFPEWSLPPGCGASLYAMHGAEIIREEHRLCVRWPRLLDLAYFLYREVFLHELGHHFHNMYRTKRPHPRTPAAEESSANRHADVLAGLPAFERWYQSA